MHFLNESAGLVGFTILHTGRDLWQSGKKKKLWTFQILKAFFHWRGTYLHAEHRLFSYMLACKWLVACLLCLRRAFTTGLTSKVFATEFVTSLFIDKIPLAEFEKHLKYGELDRASVPSRVQVYTPLAVLKINDSGTAPGHWNSLGQSAPNLCSDSQLFDVTIRLARAYHMTCFVGVAVAEPVPVPVTATARFLFPAPLNLWQLHILV